MKNWLYILFVLLVVTACNIKPDESTASENDVDAARNFIRSALDGDYVKARQYIVPDSLNNQLLNTFEDNYRNHMSREDKRGYRESSIRLPDTRTINDSTSVIKYSNSYKNKLDSLKVVRFGGKWLVDFKYSFARKDSTPGK
jgi:hypothetical protein